MQGAVGNTPFDRRLDKTLEVKRDLDRAESSVKLSAAAFLRDAMKVANCTEDRLDQIEEQLSETIANVDHAQLFVRRMVAFFREPNAPNMPSDSGKFMRAYGSAEAASQISELKATVAEFMALAVKQCGERFPDAFGEVNDFQQHQDRIADLRRQVAESYVVMQEVVSGADLAMDWKSVTINERRAGLCRVRFRRCPDVVMADGWPVDLVDALLRYDDQPKRGRGRPRKTSRPRVQLAA